MKIAVIDDEASQRSSLVRLLVSAGNEVSAFAAATDFWRVRNRTAFRAWYPICACRV